MANEYIYFTSSLPDLSFTGEPPSSVELFLEDCRSLFAGDDYTLVEGVLSGNVSDDRGGNAVVRNLVEFNQGFQNDLTHFRAERARKDASDYTRGPRTGSQHYTETIAQAGKMTNLLEAEKLIDQLRWDVWDDIVANSFFRVENVIVYALKLQMLEKYQAVRSNKGTEIFEDITDPEFLEEYLYTTNKE